MDVDFEKIKEAVRQRDELLARRPDLIPFQEKINEELRKAGPNKYNRMSVITSMLMDSLNKLAKAWESTDSPKEDKEK